MTNLLNYCAYDFDDLVLALQNRLKNRDAWKDIYRSSTGSMITEFLAYVLNVGLYYTERRAQESFLLTARNRSSIVNLVALLNYQPKRKTSATGNLVFSVDSASDKIIYIPKYTECQSVDGLKYVANEDAVIQKGQTSVTVSSVQGELVKKQITSNGYTSQEYLINDTSVENSASTSNPTFRVIVDGVEWTKVDSFLYSDSTSKHYRVINEMDGTVSVVFGNDANGMSPESGSVITLQYIKSDGLSGNVTFADKITTISSTIYDEDGSIVSGIEVTNPGSFLGGDDEEDIEEIRYEAPRVFKTGQRAVTKTDFISILENYPDVASVNVWGENEEAEAAGVPADYEMLNKVKICIVLQEWGLPDDDFKETLSNYIYDQSMLTVKYEFVEPVFLLVIPTLTIKVVTGNSISQTQSDVSGVIEDYFELGNTTKIGTKIKHSNILAAIDDLNDVAYCSLVLEIYKELVEDYDSFHDYGEMLDAIPVKAESARLFLDGEYVATDVNNGDGTGTFTIAGDYTGSGIITYATGEIGIDVAPAPSSIHVRYQQDYGVGEEGNIVPSFQQICRLSDIDVVDITME